MCLLEMGNKHEVAYLMWSQSGSVMDYLESLKLWMVKALARSVSVANR